jgi:hypothetical protein
MNDIVNLLFNLLDIALSISMRLFGSREVDFLLRLSQDTARAIQADSNHFDAKVLKRLANRIQSLIMQSTDSSSTGNIASMVGDNALLETSESNGDRVLFLG